MSVRYDLPGTGQDPIIAGNTIILDFALTGGSPAEALDLSGLTLTCYLKPAAVSPDAIASVFTTSTGLVVTDSAGGLFTWTIPRTDSLTGQPAALWYRVDVTDGSGDVETAMFGNLNLTAA